MTGPAGPPPVSFEPPAPDMTRADRELVDTWLGHLRRDRRGLPVPWINAWGAEDLAHTRIAADRWADGLPAVFHDDHGDVPDFTRQNMGRQRRSMRQGLCQVCGRPVPWRRRHLVVAGGTGENITTEQHGTLGVISEPWVDARCLHVALTWCPALIRKTRDQQLRVLKVTSPREVVVFVSTGRVDVPALLAQAGGTPQARAKAGELITAARGGAAMWAKVAPLTVRLHFT